ncbi:MULTISPECIES: hypothetical protein [Vibrio]|uniref:Uncharacterized protein n=1 Tax=Vibrio jasicida TaxID=766224 RepID=A0AAU9QV00_9VIBR|nr:MULTISPECIES: hypothetical protein [Vibrio]MCZ2799016.1 hypothetical protein [Vibrio alginolyticus]PAW02431.1 hypothetical protein CKJ79_17355 [Vibrio coralliilyticus]CAH1588532.1 conserved hypothetical protein [Vibrio jasicida]CAH1599803.1 conserved hypothetical protein [Vibrio jasicida]
MFNYRTYMGVWYKSLLQLVMMFVFVHLCSVLLFGVKLFSFVGLIVALFVTVAIGSIGYLQKRSDKNRNEKISEAKKSNYEQNKA